MTNRETWIALGLVLACGCGEPMQGVDAQVASGDAAASDAGQGTADAGHVATGYGTACSNTSECADGFVCTLFNPGDATGTCVNRCSANSQCRADTICCVVEGSPEQGCFSTSWRASPSFPGCGFTSDYYAGRPVTFGTDPQARGTCSEFGQPCASSAGCCDGVCMTFGGSSICMSP